MKLYTTEEADALAVATTQALYNITDEFLYDALYSQRVIKNEVILRTDEYIDAIKKIILELLDDKFRTQPKYSLLDVCVYTSGINNNLFNLAVRLKDLSGGGYSVNYNLLKIYAEMINPVKATNSCVMYNKTYKHYRSNKFNPLTNQRDFLYKLARYNITITGENRSRMSTLVHRLNNTTKRWK